MRAHASRLRWCLRTAKPVALAHNGSLPLTELTMLRNRPRVEQACADLERAGQGWSSMLAGRPRKGSSDAKCLAPRRSRPRGCTSMGMKSRCFSWNRCRKFFCSSVTPPDFSFVLGGMVAGRSSAGASRTSVGHQHRHLRHAVHELGAMGLSAAPTWDGRNNEPSDGRRVPRVYESGLTAVTCTALTRGAAQALLVCNVLSSLNPIRGCGARRQLPGDCAGRRGAGISHLLPSGSFIRSVAQCCQSRPRWTRPL